MARSQMLYLDKQAAITYPATGNVETGSGSRGTMSLWYHPVDPLQRCGILNVFADAGNGLSLLRVKEDWLWRAHSAGSYVQVSATSDDVAWRHVVVTWDFTGGPGAGVLRMYLDGVEVAGSPQTTASAPVGLPTELTVGPGEGNIQPKAYAAYDHLAVWDEALSAAQVADLYAAGRDHRPEEGDGSGTLLLLASWDEQFDAEVAQGSGTATLYGAPDRYCRLDRHSRHEGKRFSYRIGMPAHDGGDDDRVPLFAVLSPSFRGGYAQTNEADYGRLDVDASGTVHSVGASPAPWLPEPTGPMTLRVGVYLESLNAPNGEGVAVGPQNYIPGGSERHQCAAGCTADTFIASGLTHSDGFWAGAELNVLTGALANQRLTVAGNSQANSSVTVAGQFAAAPAEEDVFTVGFPRRLEPATDDGRLYRLEGSIEETRSGARRFMTIETAGIGAWGYTRFNDGRVQFYPGPIEAENVFFGRRNDGSIHAEWTCCLMIDRIEMRGPARYEITERTSDTFMVTDPGNGESIKAARVEKLVRELRQPQQHPDPAAVQAAMTESGSWRDSVAYMPSWMEYDPHADRLVALLVGVDPDGVERAGYIHGSWDADAGMVVWEDDPDPRNPFLVLDELREVTEGNSSPYAVIERLNGVFEVAQGDWALSFSASSWGPDGFTTCALTGARDRYSFDPREHFDESLNPVTPPLSGYDKVPPEGGGIGLFGNRDCEVMFVRNPWARSAGDRFWGYGRAKTWHHTGDRLYHDPARPLACVATGDFRNFRHIPWRNQIVAPAYGWFHWPHPCWFGPNTVGLVVDDGAATASSVGLYVSEDGVHLQRIMSAIPSGSPPLNDPWLMPLANPVRLGERRLYWYRAGKGGNNFNMASIRLSGEALYRLEDGETVGELESCSLRRTGEYWDELRVNADPKGGSVSLAVLDADTGGVIPGFDHGDCDAVAEGVERRVTWNGVGLGEIADGTVRLVIRVTRSDAGADSPEIYAWSIAPPMGSDRPRVSSVRTEGRVNPTGIANPAPDLSWEIEDGEEHSQGAYHLLVASTQEKLDANDGDLWDSGVVLSEKTAAIYAGAELESEQAYFWKVRVRNSEGVWSEEW